MIKSDEQEKRVRRIEFGRKRINSYINIGWQHMVLRSCRISFMHFNSSFEEIRNTQFRGDDLKISIKILMFFYFI